ncbi:MAG: Hsp20/alpha crystallin family protein [Spirochaetia bacterium]|nr:Hsp20/alpha crystallin family protein [Spirochaetia bacterium]
MNQGGFLFIKKDHFQIDRLFDELIHNPWSEKKFHPHADFYETEASYVFEADCPGMTIDDINLTISGDTLEISGERLIRSEIHLGSHHFRERSYGKFYRSLQIPADADRENISAEMNHGVLRVILNKLKI